MAVAYSGAKKLRDLIFLSNQVRDFDMIPEI